MNDASSAINEICVICGDFGKHKEIWFRCTECDPAEFMLMVMRVMNVEKSKGAARILINIR